MGMDFASRFFESPYSKIHIYGPERGESPDARVQSRARSGHHPLRKEEGGGRFQKGTQGLGVWRDSQHGVYSVPEEMRLQSNVLGLWEAERDGSWLGLL